MSKQAVREIMFYSVLAFFAGILSVIAEWYQNLPDFNTSGSVIHNAVFVGILFGVIGLDSNFRRHGEPKIPAGKKWASRIVNVISVVIMSILGSIVAIAAIANF